MRPYEPASNYRPSWQRITKECYSLSQDCAQCSVGRLGWHKDAEGHFRCRVPEYVAWLLEKGQAPKVKEGKHPRYPDGSLIRAGDRVAYKPIIKGNKDQEGFIVDRLSLGKVTYADSTKIKVIGNHIEPRFKHKGYSEDFADPKSVRKVAM